MADEEFSGSVGIAGPLRLGQGPSAITLQANGGGTNAFLNGNLLPQTASRTTAQTLGSIYNPNDLHMNIVRRQRTMQDDATYIVDDFLGENQPDQTYVATTISGSGAATTVAGQIRLTAGGSGWRVFSRARLRVKVPFMTCSASFQTDTTNEIGFCNAAGDHRFGARYNQASGTIDLYRYIPFSETIVTTISRKITAPYAMKLTVAWPQITVWVDQGHGWEPYGTADIHLVDDLRVESNQLLYAPFFGATLTANQTLGVSAYHVGPAEAIGFRDPRLVTMLDGTPVTRDGKYFVSFTVACQGAGYSSNHAAITSYDPDTYQMKLVSRLFYRVPASTNLGNGVPWLGALYPPQVLYDDVNDNFLVMSSSWGLAASATTTFPLWQSRTQRNLLGGGIHILDATEIAMPGAGATGYYDADVRIENGVWKMVCTTVNGAIGGTTGATTLLTGPDLNHLTVAAIDTTHGSEGPHWFRLGGVWRVCAAQFNPSNGFSYYDANLNYGGLASNWDCYGSLGGISSTGGGTSPPAPHPCFLAAADESRTRYQLITFDRTEILLEKASAGSLIVMEANETSTGHEYDRIRLLRA